jgi:hypothetical protein
LVVHCNGTIKSPHVVTVLSRQYHNLSSSHFTHAGMGTTRSKLFGSFRFLRRISRDSRLVNGPLPRTIYVRKDVRQPVVRTINISAGYIEASGTSRNSSDHSHVIGMVLPVLSLNAQRRATTRLIGRGFVEEGAPSFSRRGTVFWAAFALLMMLSLTTVRAMGL